MRDEIEQVTLGSCGALKKVIASRGTLQGSFYFAGDAGLAESGLAVTLASRDPKGDKALAAGKKLRKDITGAKFARGIVRMDGNKLVFELHQGSAKKDLLLKSFKKQLSLLDGLKFLAKAVIRKPSGEDEDDEVEEETSLAEDVQNFASELEGEDSDWLGVEKATQGSLDTLNQRLKETFLSEASAAEDEGEQITLGLSRIQTLEAARPVDATALAQARNALAAVIYVGDDPFPGVGETLSLEVTQLLKGSIEAAKQNHERFLRQTEAALRTLHEELLRREDDWILDNHDEVLSRVTGHRRAADTYMLQLESLLG